MGSFFYSENGVITKDDGKNMQKDDKTEFCPVCLEKGHWIPMVRGLPTGYYFQYRCPRCGNLALVERGEGEIK